MMKRIKCSKEYYLLTIVREFLQPTKVGGLSPCRKDGNGYIIEAVIKGKRLDFEGYQKVTAYKIKD